MMVLLITTRGCGRWVIPKGWAERGVAPHALAAREAFEEAGLLGRATPDALGRYDYRKRLPDGRRALCTVDVFALQVASRATRWKEQGQREERWVPPRKAARLVEEPGLAAILLGLDPALDGLMLAA
jgi:8-oxo-dGTP pyrophosphatase MutT (NUDIX family)